MDRIEVLAREQEIVAAHVPDDVAGGAEDPP